MAQVNHNANYLYTIDGITLWERLRVIRGFLNDRKKALSLAILSKEKNEVDDSFESKERKILSEDLDDNIEDCQNEINFLTEIENKLSVEAEKTRIPGKSDKEMYEINYFEELIQIHILQAQSELMAHGHVSSDTMKTLIRNPNSLDRVISLGLLSKETKQFSTLQIENEKTLKLIGAIDENVAIN